MADLHPHCLRKKDPGTIRQAPTIE